MVGHQNYRLFSGASSADDSLAGGGMVGHQKTARRLTCVSNDSLAGGGMVGHQNLARIECEQREKV